MNLSKLLTNFIFLKIIFLFTGVLSLFIIDSDFYYFPILINFLFVIFFFYYTKYSINSNISFNKLSLIFLLNSILFLGLFKVLFLSYNDNFFEFFAKDSIQYFNYSIRFLNNGIIYSIEEYIRLGEDIEDLGAIFFTTISSLIFNSPISFNIINIFAGYICVLSLYRLSSQFMPRKFVIIMCFTYIFSSFNFYYFSTGMKETLFIMFIILFFENFYYLIKFKQIKFLILSFLFLTALYFFRPAVLYFIILAILISAIITQRNKFKLIFLLPLALLSLFLLFQFLVQITERYFTDFESLSYRVEYAGIDSGVFSYISSFASGFLGPFPTLFPLAERIQQFFYSPGLIFKLFLSIYFYIGLINVWFSRNIFLTSIYVFIIIHTFAISFILQAFELRFLYPHFILFYMLSFYTMHNMYVGKIDYRKYKPIIKFYNIIVVILILYWNSRLI